MMTYKGIIGKINKFVQICLFFCFLFIFLFSFYAHTTFAVSSWYNSSWGYRTKITIDHTKVPNTNQSYFPVLISRTDPNWKTTANGGHVGQSDGGDIVFTSSDGAVKLDHEIETYVSSTGEIVAWVEIPTLSSSVDTDIYMYYGNASVVDQWDIANTWDGGASNSFKGVWHLADSANPTDSTSYANSGISVNGPVSTIGKTGQALTFNESNNYVSVPDSTSLQVTSQFTLSAWVYFTGNQANIDTVFMKNNANSAYYGIYLSGNRAWFYNPSIAIATTPSYSTANRWTHVVITFDSTLPSNNAKIYLNGAFDNAVTKTSAFGSNAGGTLNIGRDPVNGRYFGGKIDEVRVSNQALSADWISTEYNNQNSPSTFFSVGIEEAIPPVVPDAPTIGTATAGNTQATITFSAPASDGGSTITGYTVTSNPGGFTGTGASSPITVTGLTNGTAYTFTVTATNAVGTGSASSVSNSVTPVAVPGAPTSLIPTLGNTQVALAWTVPASNGGSTLTDYVVEYKLTSEPTTWSTFADGTSTGVTATVTGLTNGSSYDFRVSAVNAVGQGEASSTASSTPATTPDAPTIGTATAGNTQATITFSAPASDGGSTITGYTVTSNPGGFTGTGASSPITVTGLTNGTAYTFTVTATNAVGTGSASSVSNSVTLPTEPGQPTNLATTVRGSSMDLFWSSPVSNGGSSITDYVVEYKLTSGGTWSVFADGTSTITTATVTGLSNSTSYDFRVSAVNQVGQGLPTSPASGTPGEPAQVLIQGFSDVTIPTIGTMIRITNEGSAAYEYQYTWCITTSESNLCGGGDDVFSSTAAKLVQVGENWDTTLSSVVSTSGTYWYHINVLYGSTSSRADQSFLAVSGNTTPDAPTIGTATAGNTQATITFSAPASDGGSTITGYTVTSNPGGFTGTGASSPITVTGLTNGTAYTFTVTATNAVGTGSASSVSNSVTPVVPDTTAPTVSITAPINAAIVSGNLVSITADAVDDIGVVGVQFKFDTTTNIDSEDTVGTYGVTWDSTAVVDGSHTLTAVARDAAGNSTTSSAITITVDNTAPVRSAGSPSTALAYGTTSTDISLTTNESATCKYSTSAATAYDSMTAFSTTVSTSHSSNITGLTNGSNYTYYVKCQDAQGNTSATDYSITFTVSSTNSSGGGGGSSYFAFIAQTPGTTLVTVPSAPISSTPVSVITAAEFSYLSEDSTILTKLQAIYGETVVTETVYKNTCETNEGKPYYRLCELATSSVTFELFKNSVVCEGFITQQKSEKDYRFQDVAPRKEVVGIAVKMKKIQGKNVSLIEPKDYLSIYTDIGQPGEAPWIQSVAETALKYGITSSARTIFEPERDVTRAEAYAMIMSSTCMLPEKNTTTNTETEKKTWQKNIFERAKMDELTSKTWETFESERPILRQELFLLASKVSDWAERTGGCNPKPKYCFAE